jgi:hypothetical protein
MKKSCLFTCQSNRTTKFIFCLFFLVASTIGCQNPWGQQSLVDANHQPGFENGTRTPLGRGSEGVSASVQAAHSNNRKFIYSGSMASPTGSVVLKSSSGKYLLYSNVQGILLSEKEGL